MCAFAMHDSHLGHEVIARYQCKTTAYRTIRPLFRDMFSEAKARDIHSIN